MVKKKAVKKVITIFTSLIMTVFCVLNASATAGRAYSMGGEFHNGDDVKKAAAYFGICGYVSYYNTNLTYSYLSSSSVLNSDVVYFSSHGNQDAIFLPNNLSLNDGYSGSGQIVNITNYTLSNTKLVIYDACLTASNDDNSGINLCNTTLNRGADAVLGWRVTIGANDAFAWQKRFQNCLALWCPALQIKFYLR